MTTTLDKLRSELADLDVRIAAHAAACERTSGHAVNPDNEIGGMRGRSARGKAQLMDRWDRQAREATTLHDQRRTLALRIEWLESALIRDRFDAVSLMWWDALTVGSRITIGNGPLAITRKSAASVTLETGTRWTREELTGLSQKRVAELRAAQGG